MSGLSETISENTNFLEQMIAANEENMDERMRIDYPMSTNYFKICPSFYTLKPLKIYKGYYPKKKSWILKKITLIIAIILKNGNSKLH